MKKINLLFLSIATIMIFFSCKKDESPTIVGKWNLISNRTKSVITFGTSSQTSDTTEYFSSGSYIDFQGNGTYVLAEDTTRENGTYTFNNNKLTIISSTSDTTNLDVLNLTTNSAQLYLSGEDNSNGVIYSYQYWINITK